MCVLFLFSACKSLNKLTKKKGIKIEGNFTDCNGDSVRMYELDGIMLQPMKAYPMETSFDKHAFSIELQKVPQGFYFFGVNPQDVKPVILGGESSIKLEGSCKTFQNAYSTEKGINNDFNLVLNRLLKFQQDMSTINNGLRSAYSRGANTDELYTQMEELDKEKIHFIDSLEKKNLYLYRIAALRTYLSFQHNGTGYDTEADYFASEFFKYVDFADPSYDRIPLLQESIQTYAQNLAAVGLTTSVQQEHIEKNLDSSKTEKQCS